MCLDLGPSVPACSSTPACGMANNNKMEQHLKSHGAPGRGPLLHIQTCCSVEFPSFLPEEGVAPRLPPPYLYPPEEEKVAAGLPPTPTCQRREKSPHPLPATEVPHAEAKAHLLPRCRHKVLLQGHAALPPPPLRPAYCLLTRSHLPGAMPRSRPTGCRGASTGSQGKALKHPHLLTRCQHKVLH